MCKKVECPQCLSTKQYMEAKEGKGFIYKDCTLCDENGLVPSIIVEDYILAQNEDNLYYEDD